MTRDEPLAIPPARDKLLFTPGPLTTSATVKQAMLRDAGSWHFEFGAVVQSIRERLLALAAVSQEAGYEAVLMQGSGTFGVESVVTSAVPRDGKLNIASNQMSLLSAPDCSVIGAIASGLSRVPTANSIIGSPSSRMNSGVPQAGQNPRLTIADERNIDGAPRVQVRSAASTDTSAAPKLPKAFWHMRQWQIPARPRRPAIL